MKNSTTNHINCIVVEDTEPNNHREVHSLKEVIEDSIQTFEDFEKYWRQELSAIQLIIQQIKDIITTEDLSEEVSEEMSEKSETKPMDSVFKGFTQTIDSLNEEFKQKSEEFENKFKELIENWDHYKREMDVRREVIKTLNRTLDLICSSDSEPLKKKIKMY